MVFETAAIWNFARIFQISEGQIADSKLKAPRVSFFVEIVRAYRGAARSLTGGAIRKCGELRPVAVHVRAHILGAREGAAPRHDSAC